MSSSNDWSAVHMASFQEKLFELRALCGATGKLSHRMASRNFGDDLRRTTTMMTHEINRIHTTMLHPYNTQPLFQHKCECSQGRATAKQP